MKLATVRFNNNTLAGVVRDDSYYALSSIDSRLPNDMLALIEGYEGFKPIIDAGLGKTTATCKTSEAVFLSPLQPKTIRDFIGFEEHTEKATTHFGFPMDLSKTLEAWRKAPGFYYSNTNAINGSDEPIDMHPSSKMFDFEFEFGFIIGKRGRDISKENAMDYIFGLTIFNDWSARDIQLQELPLGAGTPLAKGYANGFGPVIVTKDEIDQYLCKDDPYRYDIATKLTFNGKVLRENNLKTIYYTFADMIAWASRDTYLVPGDVFGSGTIGGGCLAEYPPDSPWLQAGDIIEMEAQGIGVLKNKVM
jgi:2-keto-4-pentenoate hydratase/2-oxohepta-3-ene-1,7-dioic acid hydratase in catechol pathway